MFILSSVEGKCLLNEVEITNSNGLTDEIAKQICILINNF